MRSLVLYATKTSYLYTIGLELIEDKDIAMNKCVHMFPKSTYIDPSTDMLGLLAVLALENKVDYKPFLHIHITKLCNQMYFFELNPGYRDLMTLDLIFTPTCIIDMNRLDTWPNTTCGNPSTRIAKRKLVSFDVSHYNPLQ
jgi:hypothetical protein